MSNIPLTAGPELPVQNLPEQPKPEASVWEGLGAVWQRENDVTSFMVNSLGLDPGPADPAFSLTEALRGSRFENRFDTFVAQGAYNRTRFDNVLRQLENEDRNTQLAEQLPWYLSLPVGIAAGVLSPTTLLPGAGLVRSVRGGYSIARSAAVVGASAGASVAAQEALLQSTQLSRPLSESVVNVGAGVILGGFIGAGAAGLLGRAEYLQATRGVRQAYMDDPTGESAIQSLTPARRREWDTAAPARKVELADSESYTIPEASRTLTAPRQAIDDIVNTPGNYVAKGIDDIQQTLDDAPTLTPDLQRAFVAIARTAEDLEAGRFAIVARNAEPEVLAKIQEAYPERVVMSADEFTPTARLEPESRTAYTPTSAADLSAASAEVKLSPSDSEIYGGLAKALADKLQWLSPNIRQQLNPIAALRVGWMRAVDTALLTKGAAEGVTVAPGGAASRRALFIGNNYLRVKDKVDRVYADMIKSGTNMSREDFHENIGNVLKYDTDSTNEFVNKAAKLWQDHYDFMFAEGVKAGVYKADIDGAADLAEGARFFPRDSIYQSFVDHREIFEKRVSDWYRGYLQEQYSDNYAKFQEKIGELQSRQKFLTMSTEDVEANIKAIQEMLAEEALPAAINKALKSEMSNMRQTLGGYELAQRRLQERIDGLVESSEASLNRVLQAGRRLERELGNFDARTETRQAAVERIRETLTKEQTALEKQIVQAEAKQEELSAKYAEAVQKEIELFRGMETASELASAPSPVVFNKINMEDLSARYKQELDKARSAGLVASKEQDKLAAELTVLARQRAEFLTAKAQRQLLADIQEQFDTRFPGATPEEQLDLARQGINFIVAKVNELNLQRGGKIREIVTEMAKRDPSVVKERIAKLAQREQAIKDQCEEKWFERAGGVRPKDPFEAKPEWLARFGLEKQDAPTAPASALPDFSRLANNIAKDLADSYMGRGQALNGADVPVSQTRIVRGPLKNRTNIVPNNIMDPPDAEIKFFYSNAEDVAQLHSRRVSGQIALGQMFNGDWKLDKYFGTADTPGLIKQSFDDARAQALTFDNTKDLYEYTGLKPKRNESLADARVRAAQHLNAWETTTKADWENMYRAMSGTLYAKEQLSTIGSISRIAKAIAYIRVMGGQAIAMFTDLYTPALALGIRNHLSQGVLPLISSSQIRGMAKSELEFMGLALNHVVNRNVLAMAEIGDPLARGNVVERVLDKMTGIGSKWNGSQFLQDGSETLAGMTTMRLLMQKVGKFSENAKDLADAGINEQLAKRIFDQIEIHKQKYDGVEFPRVEAWKDEEAQRAFSAAVQRQVDMVFSTKRLGNTPWIMAHPVGGMILQFQSYNIAQTQTILLRGLQDNQRRLLQGLIPLTMMGAAVAYVQAALRGGESLEKFERNMAENPGFLIAEGLDRGSPFPLAFTMANLIESGTRSTGADNRFNPIKDAVMRPFGPLPEELQYTPMGRDFATQLLGPTVGGVGPAFSALGGLGSALTGTELSSQQQRGIQAWTPYGTYPGMRQALQWLFDDLPGSQ